MSEKKIYQEDLLTGGEKPKKITLGGQIPSNSIKSKEEVKEKRVNKVITGGVVTKKKTFSKKLAEIFIGDDVNSVGGYILYDVLIPAAKNTLSEMVSTGIEMLLFGEAKSSRTRRDKGKSYVSYSSYYNKNERDTSIRREASKQNKIRHNFDDIILETRVEAEDVLSHLVDLTEDYGQATVADLYDLVGMSTNFTDNKYGWENLESASVQRVRNGYLINLPKAILLA